MHEVNGISDVAKAAAGECPDREAMRGSDRVSAVPDYLLSNYRWAYLNRNNARLLDSDTVVGLILLGNNRRLRRAILAEVNPGQRVLQAAHVYGCLIPELARQIGPCGHLDVVDVLPLQAALCRRMIRNLQNTRVKIADAANPGIPIYDVVSCFFLLHEIPGEKKRAVTDALLSQVAPGGRAVFIDYHRPASWQPLCGMYRRIFGRLEPYAQSMWHHDVRDFTSCHEGFQWKKWTMFGGIYQKAVAYRVNPDSMTDCQSTIRGCSC